MSRSSGIRVAHHGAASLLRLRTQSFVVSILMLLVVSACSKPDSEKDAVVTVQVAPVHRGELHLKVDSQAILFPIFQSTLVPKISAPINKFYVNRGSRVHRGQLLAVLENRDLAAAAAESQGALEQAQAGYEITTGASLPEEIRKAEHDATAAKQSLDAEEKVYQSRQELFRQGALPRKELDQSGVTHTQARNQYDLAQKHLEALQAVGKIQSLKAAAGQLAAARGKQMGAEAQLSYSEIRSPIDGVVTDRPLFPGEMAQAGAPLLTVMDTSKVIARPHIASAEAALFKVGDTATLTVPGESDPVPAKVTVISPALDPNSTTIEIWVQADNPGQRLKPGSSVQVSILAETAKGALVVPATAVLTDTEGSTAVMVVDSENVATRRVVKTGIRDGGDVQIVEGLKSGERVVTVGAYGLPDKTKVQAETAVAEKAEGKGEDKADDKKAEDKKDKD
jgi:HlyD family secretion protein